MEQIIIETKRLELRLMTPEFYQHLFDQFSESEQMQILGLKNADELKLEREKFDKGLRTHNKSFAYFLLFDKSTRNLVGFCGFHMWYLDHNRAEIGYALYDDSIKRKGLMTEAMTKVLSFGFDELKLHRMEAMIGTNNEASKRLVKGFGFQYEGLMKEHYLKDGVYEDSEVYGLIKDHYRR